MEVARYLFPRIFRDPFAYGENEDGREIIFIPHGEASRLLEELAEKCGF